MRPPKLQFDYIRIKQEQLSIFAAQSAMYMYLAEMVLGGWSRRHGQVQVQQSSVGGSFKSIVKKVLSLSSFFRWNWQILN